MAAVRSSHSVVSNGLSASVGQNVDSISIATRSGVDCGPPVPEVSCECEADEAT